MNESDIKLHRLIERIAKVCHETNRAYCQTLDDNSLQPWEKAPEWQKESSRTGVAMHLSGDYSPEYSHKSWIDQKAASGWVYGETKDEDKKTHPCMVSFQDLPLDQQVKDILFCNVVQSFKQAASGMVSLD